MPNYLRPNISGATIFFTVNVARHNRTVLTDEIERLREAVRQTKAERPFDIDAWVVLPHQMHCIWKLPVGDGDFPTRWRLIKSRFSRGLPEGMKRNSHELRRERGIWQRRYWEHHIRDNADHMRHLRHCWFAPVRHGLVKAPTDWPYSSIHRDARYLPDVAAAS